MSNITSDYDFEFPQNLVASEPSGTFRAMMVKVAESGEPWELSDKRDLFDFIKPGDILVVNDTRVEKRRVFAEDGTEVLFVRPKRDASTVEWQVLFPAREFNINDQLKMPGGLSLLLLKKGLPQVVQLNKEIDKTYFAKHGEPALPPYIQHTRDNRHALSADENWYQTDWAREHGSCAAPTASLHFSSEDLQGLQEKGVQVHKITLHVGLGTFLPIKSENLEDHEMHGEEVSITADTVAAIKACHFDGKKVWAMGTTVVRALESQAAGLLEPNARGDFTGVTELFIKPGFDFKYVDCLLTNFHQPKSSLMTLISAFAGRYKVLHSYQWAMAQKFRLFSYGDLTVWIK